MDFDLRARLLSELESTLVAPDAEALREMVECQDARAKLYVVTCLLRLRAERPALFTGGYRALFAEGESGDGWFAFARTADDEALIVAVRRFSSPPSDALSTVEATGFARVRQWRNVLTGDTCAEDCLPLGGAFPWAVWVAER